LEKLFSSNDLASYIKLINDPKQLK